MKLLILTLSWANRRFDEFFWKKRELSILFGFESKEWSQIVKPVVSLLALQRKYGEKSSAEHLRTLVEKKNGRERQITCNEISLEEQIFH